MTGGTRQDSTSAEARTRLEARVAANPTDTTALRALARACAAMGDVDAALRHMVALTRRLPEPLEDLAELARYCQAQQRLPVAIEAYERFLARRPQSAVAHFNCAWFATRLGRHEFAIAHYRKALELGIERPAEVHVNIARACADGLRDDAAARRHLQQALALAPGYLAAWYNLGNLAEQQGDVGEARRCFARCLELDPDNPSALARLADTHDFATGEQPLFERLAALAARSPDADLHFALGRALEQRGDPAGAWRHYGLANAGDRRSHPPYDPAAVEAQVSGIIATCGADWLQARASDQPHSPVFICGMFRSGSTLLEQVLAAHPAFTAGGEREFLPRLVASELPGFPAGLEQVTARQVRSWASAYAAESRRLFGRHGRLTDKRPDNLLHLGLARAMFPRARFVITQRDLRDVATSIYATRLGPGQPYATDPAHIAHYLRQQSRLATHWATLFGDHLLTVGYEALVTEPRATVGSLLGALGEPWDERCLAFHDLRNTVRTASVWQVRQPLYAASIGRWRRFPEAWPDLD